MAVLDIRGTHGSGKSWIVHQLIKEYGGVPIHEGSLQVGVHLPEVDAAVVGTYNRVCGGCDGIKAAAEVVRRVRTFHGSHRHVVLEGILVAHTFKRYDALARELGDYVFLFLDTPLRVCLDRVRARRRAAGNRKPLDPTNLVRDWHCVWERMPVKCRGAGHRVVVLDHVNPLPTVRRLLEVDALEDSPMPSKEKMYRGQ